MSRRVALPGAAELFRNTDGPARRAGGAAAAAEEVVEAVPGAPGALLVEAEPETDHDHPASDQTPRSSHERAPRAGSRRSVRRPVTGDASRTTGRERHDEKITVYISPEELVALEQARLFLRADHGVAVDRGRIVREALTVVLADLEAKGAASILVRRLRQG